ncbi:MAG: hypothetical protein ABR506_12085 [Candidatus Krumholzibacteriia bacterium]
MAGVRAPSLPRFIPSFLLLVVGHPADDATVPRITRKPPDLIMGIR